MVTSSFGAANQQHDSLVSNLAEENLQLRRLLANNLNNRGAGATRRMPIQNEISMLNEAVSLGDSPFSVGNSAFLGQQLGAHAAGNNGADATSLLAQLAAAKASPLLNLGAATATPSIADNTILGTWARRTQLGIQPNNKPVGSNKVYANTTNSVADIRSRLPVPPISALPFPLKIHRILDEAAYKDIIAFLPHGKSFAIFSPHRFIAEVMPKFFKTARLSSFERQLNMYGFRRVSDNAADVCYYHAHFQKDRPDLLSMVKRRKQRIPTGNSNPSDDRAAIEKAMLAMSRNRHLLIESNRQGVVLPGGEEQQQQHLRQSLGDVGKGR